MSPSEADPMVDDVEMEEAQSVKTEGVVAKSGDARQDELGEFIAQREEEERAARASVVDAIAGGPRLGCPDGSLMILVV